MKQAIKLYTTIRKNQFIMASLLGIFLIVFAVGSNLLFRNIPNQETDYELGPVLMVVWLIVTVIVLLNDQSRHLDTWLYTQNISRGQLFLTRVILMVVGPIIAASVIDICLTAMLEYHNISRVLMVDITAAANLFFISSVFIGIFIVIGPNWMKAAGTVFTFGLPGPHGNLHGNYNQYKNKIMLSNRPNYQLQNMFFFKHSHHH